MRGERSFRLADWVRRLGPGLLGLATAAAAALYLIRPGADEPATLTSPDGSIAITLYAYRPKAGTTWFEAGLRSVRDLNLDGRCRTGAA